MDKKLILTRPDALELYCSLIYTYENKNILEGKEEKIFSSTYTSFKGMDYRSEVFLGNAFAKFRTENLTHNINEALTGEKRNKRFYNFSNRVRFHEQIHMSKFELDSYLGYLRNNHQIISAEIIDRLAENIKENKLEQSQLTISSRVYSLAKTQWVIFYWDNENEVSGITRSLLTFDHFSRASILDYNSKMHRHDYYKGEYEVYDKHFLRISLKLMPAKTKDLHICCYMGNSENVTLYLGQYNDISARIYSGNLVIKKLTQRISEDQEKFFVKFFPASTDADEISQGVKEFLSTKESNFIAIRDMTVTEVTLSEARG